MTFGTPQDARAQPARPRAALSIRSKLAIAFLLVALVPLAAVTAWNVTPARRAWLGLAEDLLLSNAQDTVQVMEAYLQERRLDAQRMALGPVLLPFTAKGRDLTGVERRMIQRGFESHRRSYGYLRVALLGPDGDPVVTVGDLLPIGAPQSQAAFREAFRGTVAVSDPFFAGPHGPYVVEIAAPVRDRAGTIRGAILFALPFERFTAILEAEETRSRALRAGVLVDGQMIRIAHASNPALIGRPLVPLPAAEVDTAVQAGRFGSSTANLLRAPATSPGLKEKITALRRDPRASPLFDTTPAHEPRLSRAAAALLRSKPWAYAVTVPYDVLLAPVQAQLRRSLLAMGLAAAAAALLAYGLGDLMARRVASLAETASRLAAGDLTARAAAGPGDEVGRVAQTFNTMAQAIQDRERQVEAVRAVSEEVLRELDLGRVLDLITRRAAELIGAPSGTLFLWDEATQLLIPKAWHGIGDWVAEVRQRPGEGTAGVVAQRRAGIVVHDYASWELASPLFRERTGATATMGEPLLYRDRLLGVLVINNLGTARRFTPEDSRLLALLAGQAAIAIENARLYDETQRQAREARALAEVGRSLSASSRGTRCSSESSRRSPGSWASNSRGS